MDTSTRRIAKLKYYYWRINREDAELILKQLHTPKIGLYLLRNYTEIPGNYIISLVCNHKYEYQMIIYYWLF